MSVKRNERRVVTVAASIAPRVMDERVETER